MAKKVNEVQNGDLKSNIVVLRSVFGKVGQKYFIQPQRDSRGRYASCVKRVDANDDIILTPEELLKESRGEAVYIKENEVFIIEDGKLRLPRRQGCQGCDKTDVHRGREARHRQTSGELPSARRDFLAPALLGRAVPDSL